VAESIASLAGAPTAEHAWRPIAATRASAIAALALVGIFTHVALRWGSSASAPARELPLHVVLVGAACRWCCRSRSSSPDDVYAGQTPEQKVAITRWETERAPTLFIGDGINDAPALATATVGLAFGHQSEITTEAAGAVIMDTSLERIDELFHLARRMRRIALQSAVGGMG
jgi:magnesium-transporting ATPase (P-type)